MYIGNDTLDDFRLDVCLYRSGCLVSLLLSVMTCTNACVLVIVTELERNAKQTLGIGALSIYIQRGTTLCMVS